MLYRKVFPAQADYMRPYFPQAFTQQEITVMQDMLIRLRKSCRKEASL